MPWHLRRWKGCRCRAVLHGCGGIEVRGVVREGGRGEGRAGWGKRLYLATVDALRPDGMRLQIIVREELPPAEAAGEVDD